MGSFGMLLHAGATRLSNQTKELKFVEKFWIAKLVKNGYKNFANVKESLSRPWSYLPSAQRKKSLVSPGQSGTRNHAHAPSSNFSTAPTPVQKVKFSTRSLVSAEQLLGCPDDFIFNR
jgi:hypothetical protein